MQTIAFIDGQNVYVGISKLGWKIEYARLRIYLRDKYSVSTAYYFLGYKDSKFQSVYDNIQSAGFELIFKDTPTYSSTHKKGNVDTDVVFEIMKSVIERTVPHKILIIPGDGDYIKTVTYLIQKERFSKILLPNKRYASKLYTSLEQKYYDFIQNIRHKVEYKNEKGP